MQVRDDGVDREQEPAARQDSGDDLEWRAEFEAGRTSAKTAAPTMMPAARPSEPS